MELTISHSVVYDFEGRATVVEVAKSIVAQDRLVREALSVLEELFPHLTLESAVVSIRAVSQASPLKTDMQTLVIAAYATAMGEDVPDVLDTLFGIDVVDGYDSIVSVLVLLIAIRGIDWLRLKIFPGKKEPDLQREKDKLLATAANQASVTEEHMEEALERVLAKHKRSIMKASADFLEPAKRLKAASISVKGAQIGRPAIEAMPSDLDLAQYEPATEVEVHENVVVQFRAHDLDKNKSWAATIDAIFPQRRPLHLAPDVSPEQLFERKEVRGDVLVTSTLDADGEYVPNLYYLQKVYDEDGA